MRLRNKRPEQVEIKAGRDGIDGKDGENGLPGKDGIDGRNGTDGRDGLDGKDGLHGLHGRQGEIGPEGKAGPRGSKGAKGDSGSNGLDGWSPILAVVEDGQRRVHQVTGWTGGTGAEPESGWFIGPRGPVDRIEDATDIRGPKGEQQGGGGLSVSALRKIILETIGATPIAGDVSVRTTAVDTAITESDDLLIVTAEATITMPTAVGATKIYRIKRSGDGDVTVVGIGGQTIEGESSRVINVNLYALVLASDGSNWVEW